MPGNFTKGTALKLARVGALLLLASLFHFPSLFGAALQQRNIRLIREFKRHSLGLLDISSDGQLLLMHENLDRNSYRLRVLDANTQREVASLKFDGDTYSFVPGSHQVILSGTVLDPSEVKGYLIWDTDSRKIQKNEMLTKAGFHFIQFIDAKHLLGAIDNAQGKRTYAQYDPQSETLTPFDIKEYEPIHLAPDESGFLFSPDHRTIVGKIDRTLTFRKLTDAAPKRRLEIGSGEIESCAYSPDGKLFLVVSENEVSSKNYENNVRIVEKAHLSIFDAETLKPIAQQQILTKEIEEGSIAHVGFQLGISPNGRWAVVGYDHLTTRLFSILNYSQAKYAVYELPLGRHIGTVEHPPVRIPGYMINILPAQSGNLRFSLDGNHFYTTSEFTRLWELPQLFQDK